MSDQEQQDFAATTLWLPSTLLRERLPARSSYFFDDPRRLTKMW